MQPARRLERLPIYVFASIGAKIRALEAKGMDVIRLDIGSPDGPPTELVIQTLARSAANPRHHGYTGYLGTPRLRQAMGDYYAARFGVNLDTESEILPVIGSKEGIAHMALAWLDPGDLAIVPDPGYPAYPMGALMAGADVYQMALLEENQFLPDLDAIPHDVAVKARLMWLNYPNNPTGAVAPLSFLEKAVDFCREYEILLCHDAPYADVCFEGYRAPSILSIRGASDVAVEFNSLSKSHNMAGWRIGMAVGNKAALHALLQIKSNVDSGIFLPIQDAVVMALTEDQSWIVARNKEYELRRDMLLDLLAEDWGLRVMKPLAGLYLWPRLPEGVSSVGFADQVLTQTGVSLTPGTAFGSHGEGYLRISVGQTTEKFAEAVARLREVKL